MQQNHRRSTHHTTRRRVLGSLGLAAAGLGVAGQPVGATTAALSSDSGFVVEQGDLCVPVVPISGDVPIEERYGWAVEGADFSSTGLVGLQRRDTSILFLYDGPEGLSLVVVHDKYGDGTNGGSVTFEFTGLPLDGEWAVQDDYYDEDSNYDQWTRNGDEATVDWTWSESRTDGGAFRGLSADSDLEIQITPSFNAEATLYGEHYEGELTAWEVVSGSGDGRTRTSLALDEPIVLRRGTCSTDGNGDDSDDSEDGDDSNDDSEDSTDEDDSEDSEDSSDSTDGDDSDDSSDSDDSEDGDDNDDDEDSDDEDSDDSENRGSDSSDDDHPGNGKGHEKGNGKGHEKGHGKGHEKGNGKGHEKGNGKGHEKGKGKGH